MRLGLVGLPNSGKTTLFNALTCVGAPAEPYPFTTIEPNTGMATVPDEKLAVIAELAGCEKAIPAQIKVVDIAGLVEGASEGAGLGNRFLAHIREMDAIIIVLACFGENPTPVVDLELLEVELALADLEVARKRVEKQKRQAKGKKTDPKREREVVLLEEVCAQLDRGVGVHLQRLGNEDLTCLEEVFLLTAKPRLVVVNLAPEDTAKKLSAELDELSSFISKYNESPCALSALLEEEAAMLAEEEAAELLKAYGLEGPEIGGLIRASYELLGLVTFYTIQGGIAQSWSVAKGTPVRKAAGLIHSDLAEGFIKAEVVDSDELVSLGSYSEVCSAGRLRIEGEDCPLHGGEVVKILNQ